MNKRSIATLAALLAPLAASAAPGDVVWTYATGAPVWASPALDGELLIVAADDGRIHALDRQQRRPRWIAATGGKVRAKPLVAADRVIVASDDGWLHALSRADGRSLWRFDLKGRKIQRREPDADMPFYDHLHSAPVLADGIVYIGGPAGHLFAIDVVDGKQIWSMPTGDMIRATPVVADGRVIVGGWDGIVYAVDAKTGKPAWHKRADGIVQSSTVIGNLVIAASRHARLLAYDARTGAESWNYRFEDGTWIESTPVGDADRFYVGTSDALALFAFDTASGKPAWTYRTGGWSWATPLVAGGTVYVGAIDAKPYYVPGVTLSCGLHAVDAVSGKKRWEFAPTGRAAGFVGCGMAATPARADGMLYAPAVDGQVYVLSEG